eukprot:5557205-Amphidinium_carterae.1
MGHLRALLCTPASCLPKGVGFMPRADQDAIINEFINDSCAVISVGSDLMLNLVVTHALQHPDLYFLCLTCRFLNPSDQPFNVAAIDIAIHQAGFIGGAIAATQAGVSKIGYVGSNYVPPSFRNVNSFTLGALSVNPDIDILITHAGTWFDPRTERIAAKRLVLQHQVDLLAYDSDSDEIVKVAREMGVLSVAIK